MNHVHRRNGKVENNFYGWPDAGEAAGFPAMTRDLELPKHGLHVLPLPSTITPLANGDYLGSWDDPDKTRREP